MNNWLFDFFNQYMVFYSGLLMLFYLLMVLVSYFSHRHNRRVYSVERIRQIFANSPQVPGVSIIAPAYNEEKVVVDCVASMLNIDYPIFEVVVVNDGSKDKTLEELIKHYDLVEVPYAYVERIRTRPYRALYRSTNPEYKRLTVVDKENGGTKADASNAGINVAQYPYFVCIDIDCILSPDALYHVVWPLMNSQERIVAVGGLMRMLNGCTFENARLKNIRPPRSPLPLFQELEYMRSYLLGKTWWSQIRGMSNVSGGFGFFDKQIAINVGGYDGDSFAEDMDLLARMTAYMFHLKQKFRVVQVPQTCCWTEGPGSLVVFNRQRTRWASGLFQFFTLFHSMMFRSRYKSYGLVTLPYIFIFEFLGPVIEFTGLCVLIYLICVKALNWDTFFIVFFAIYAFSQLINISTVAYDIYVGSVYRKKRSYFRLMLASLIEPFTYHVLNVIFSLKGYLSFLFSRRMKWGEMKRQGVKKETTSNVQPAGKAVTTMNEESEENE